MYDRQDQQVITRLHDLTKEKKKSVVLTFDDGPGRYLEGILDTLKIEDAPAMFFWQSRLLYPKRPWQRVLDEGHHIGSHSYKHLDLRNLEYDDQYKDLFYSKKKIEEITGQKVRYFRPPFGQYDSCTLKVIQKLELTPVLWSTTAFDLRL
mgnify:CR=1 FL=1